MQALEVPLPLTRCSQLHLSNWGVKVCWLQRRCHCFHWSQLAGE